MTIIARFRHSSYRTFDERAKHVQVHLKKYFPKLVSYGRS